MVGHLNHFEPRFLLENEYFDQVLNGVIFSTKSMAELMCFCPKRRKIGYVGAQPVFRAVTLPLVLSTEPTRPERGSHTFLSAQAGGGGPPKLTAYFLMVPGSWKSLYKH